MKKRYRVPLTSQTWHEPIPIDQEVKSFWRNLVSSENSEKSAEWSKNLDIVRGRVNLTDSLFQNAQKQC
jgi:hypothetical protein